MSEEQSAELEQGLARLGFAQPDALAGRLRLFAGLLLEANRHTNLVGVKTFDDLLAAHLLDSLAPLAGQSLEEPIIDAGSGAGLPGIPAALAWPERRFVLLEARTKRAAFLRDVVTAMGLANASVEKMSAESAARGPLREQAGTVLARALAKPAAALEIALPLLAPQGRLFLYTGRKAAPDRDESAVITRAGGRLVEARRVEVPYLDAERHVWIVEKRPPRAAAPAGYRRPTRRRRRA